MATQFRDKVIFCEDCDKELIASTQFQCATCPNCDNVITLVGKLKFWRCDACRAILGCKLRDRAAICPGINPSLPPKKIELLPFFLSLRNVQAI